METIKINLDNATEDCLSFARVLYENNSKMITKFERKSKIEESKLDFQGIFFELLNYGSRIFYDKIYSQPKGYKTGALLGQLLNGSIIVPQVFNIHKYLSEYVREGKEVFPEYAVIGDYDELLEMIDNLNHYEQMLLIFTVRCHWIFDLFKEYNYTCKRAAIEFPIIF